MAKSAAPHVDVIKVVARAAMGEWWLRVYINDTVVDHARVLRTSTPTPEDAHQLFKAARREIESWLDFPPAH